MLYKHPETYIDSADCLSGVEVKNFLDSRSAVIDFSQKFDQGEFESGVRVI